MMAFKKSFVVSLKVDGKILREDGDFVDLPFGSEYSILLKNLNTRRALVNIDIDGARVFSGLVIDKNQTVELERFEKKNNKFKFIEKTAQISNHRGDFIDDGFIRVEFQYEKDLPVITYRDTWPYNHNYDFWGHQPLRFSAGTGVRGVNHISAEPQIASYSVSYDANTQTLDKGITVPGSESNQSFTTTTMRELEPNSDVIIIRLRGKNGSNFIQAPIMVNTKIECPICGKMNKSNVKFCSNCGTYLR